MNIDAELNWTLLASLYATSASTDRYHRSRRASVNDE